MMFTDTIYCIVMIHGSGTHGHIQAVHAMWDVDIFNIFSHIAALDMKILNIRHGHNNHIRIHLHHQSDQLLLPDIIGTDLVLFFCQCEDLILRVTGNIMNGQIRMG